MLNGLPETTSIYECSKLLISSGWVDDKEFLESAINASIENIEQGLQAPTVEAEDAPKSANDSSEELQDFSVFKDLDDSDLLEVVADLFSQCKDLGASDLYLTARTRLTV